MFTLMGLLVAEVVVIHKSWPTECVRGVALLKNELFVLCQGRVDSQVDVHSTDTYTLLRRLTVPGLGRYTDVTTSSADAEIARQASRQTR